MQNTIQVPVQFIPATTNEACDHYGATAYGCGCPDAEQRQGGSYLMADGSRGCKHRAHRIAQAVEQMGRSTAFFGATLTGANGEPSCGCITWAQGFADCDHIEYLKAGHTPTPTAPVVDPIAAIAEDIAIKAASIGAALDNIAAIDRKEAELIDSFTLTLEQRQAAYTSRQKELSDAIRYARAEHAAGLEVSDAYVSILASHGIDDEEAFWAAIEPDGAYDHGYVPGWQDELPPYSSEYQAWDRSHGPIGHRLSV